MAERTTIVTEVAHVAEAAGNEGVSGPVQRTYSNIAGARRKRQRARRVEALCLKLAGVSTAPIAERMGIAPDTVRQPDQPHPADGRKPRQRGDAGAGERPAGSRPGRDLGTRCWPETTGPRWSSCRSASAVPN